MAYREAASMERVETWGDRARAVARIARWITASALSLALFCGAVTAAVRACNAPPSPRPPEPPIPPKPCVESVALVNLAGLAWVDCAPGARVDVTQVATGQLVRCVCGPR